MRAAMNLDYASALAAHSQCFVIYVLVPRSIVNSAAGLRRRDAFA